MSRLKLALAGLSSLVLAVATTADAAIHLEAENGTLTIYTKTNFYHKKLDTPRVLGILQSALQNQGISDWNITLVPTTKPPSDSQAAAVAAMMGGGEEVHIDE